MLTSIKYSVLLCSTSCRSMVGNYAYVLVTCAGPSRQGYFGFKVDASLKSKSLQVISALVAVAVLSQVPAKLLKHREHQAQEPSSTSSTYLTVGMFSGLNNQRLCLLNGMALAKLHNWTLVLPNYVVEYNAYQDATLVPLGDFYDVHHIASAARTIGFRVVEYLPRHKHAACMLQLQHHRAQEAPNLSLLNAWAANHGVVCITALNALTLHENAPLELSDMRLALRPAKHYKSEVFKIISQMVRSHNTSSVPAVHVRVQPDWVASCPQWGRKENLQCMVGEEQLVSILGNAFNLTEGSMILVISDTPIEELPILCGHFSCINKAVLWGGKSSDLSHSTTTLAFIDFVLACKMQQFYGNCYSSFTQEVIEVLNADGRQGTCYNPNCPEGQDCP